MIKIIPTKSKAKCQICIDHKNAMRNKELRPQIKNLVKANLARHLKAGKHRIRIII